MQRKELLWNVRRRLDGQTYGPYTRQELAGLVREHRLALEDVARSETGEVMQVGDVIEGRPSSMPRSVEAPIPRTGRSETQPPEYSERAEVPERQGYTAEQLPQGADPAHAVEPEVAWGTWSIASVICAAANLLLCPVLSGVAGIILAGVGMNEGETKATTALIISIVSTVISVVVMVVGLMLYKSMLMRFTQF